MNKVSSRSFWSRVACAAVVLWASVSVQAQTNTNHFSIANTNRVAFTNPPAPRRPSILLILADNVGYGDLGSYGQTKIKTPNLDKLASQGIRFTSFYAGSPVDDLSRAALFTGMEPRHSGASFSHPLPMDALTVAAVLQEKGFHTGLMGEWNLGDTPPVQPNAKGFNEFAGFLSQAHARQYFSESIYRQDTVSGSNRVVSLADNWDGARKAYTPDLVGKAAGNFMRIHEPDKLNSYAPFFLCVAYAIPHEGELPKDPAYEQENWPQPLKDRATMITRMDTSIGALMDQLASLRMDTNTVVIFTSVGGPKKEGAMDPKFFNSAGPLTGEAGWVYEGGIRVPMIIRWPARIKPGQVSDFTWAAWDLLPTLAEIGMIQPPKNVDGISILPTLTAKGKVAGHENFYWETRENGSQQAVRMGDWKIIRLGTNAPALYNLKRDIGETEDVAGKHVDVMKKMEPLLGSPLK